jgi:hypothetical protein
VENAELAQHRPAVVVDFFSGQSVIGVEGVDTAKWELHPPPGRRETAPGAELRSANHDFEDDCLVADVAPLDLDLQVRQSLHQLLVELADSVASVEVFAPGLVVVARGVAESPENAFEIMRVLQPDVFFDNCDSRRKFVMRVVIAQIFIARVRRVVPNG